jgi:hypothetical protein
VLIHEIRTNGLSYLQPTGGSQFAAGQQFVTPDPKVFVQVMSIDPSAATATVRISYTTFLVPNLLGQSPTDAQSIAQQAGFGMYITGTVVGLEGPTVYSQQPAPGTSAPPGTTINVVILVQHRPAP